MSENCGPFISRHPRGGGEEVVGGDRLAYRVPVLIIRADKGTVIESVP